MDVTRNNFTEALPVISQAIEDSSFLSIDAEFTGLTSWTRKTEHSLDTCEERYDKVTQGIKNFTIPQFGLCTFSWDEEQQHYTAKPFNFYIFPKPYTRQMPDTRFLCQSSSLDFLANQKFDFNKWVYEGIPFVLPRGEEKLRQVLDVRRKEDEDESSAKNGSKGSGKIAIPPEFEKSIKLFMKQVSDFTEDPAQKSLSLPPSTPFVRKLMYSSVKSVYASELHLETKMDEKCKKYIQIIKVSKDEKEYLQNKKIEREDEELELAVGFSKVIRLISESGKVILGHNMLLDLLHVVRLFVSPLPHHLNGFKALIKCTLPRLVDTKVMASTQPLQEHFSITHLDELYKKTTEHPFVKPNIHFPEGFGLYSEGERSHEAGFDAYMTGVSFISMVAYLQKIRDGDTPNTQLDLEVIKPFLNKIFLFPRIEDIPYLNLSDKDLSPKRDHVFYLDQFPETWKLSDIQRLFNKDFGYVYVSRLNSTSAYVSVAKKDRAVKVLQKLDVDGVPYRIMSYKEYQDSYCGDDSDESSYYSLNKSQDTSSAQTSSNPEPAKISQKLSKEVMPSDGEIEDGEIADSPQPPRKKLRSEEVEEGEIPDSPEPIEKKGKGQHTFFDEPDEW